MVNKQLIDWIKSEEAQGYSDQQLNPKFCKDLDYKERDECIIKYSLYDKEICEEIRDESLKDECLHK